jgi:tetratricopeptide (TPR) repeat protein
LGNVARNASISLGRNLGDSIDRLFRGVAKLEPEILDELGILVRLDTAVENYAAKLGKAATDLSDFERRQAFLNAAIEQGEIKYGRIAGVVDPNPYDKLAAAFADLTKKLIGFANFAITPLITLLSQNTGLLLGSLILFVSTIVGQMFPALTEMGNKSIEAAEKAKTAARAQEDAAKRIIAARKKTVIGSKLGGAAMTQLRMQLAQNKEVKNYDKAINQLIKSEKLRENNLKNMSGKQAARKKRELEQVRQLRAEVEALKLAEEGRAKSQVAANIARKGARGEQTISGGVVAIGETGGLGGFKEANKAFGKYRANVNATLRAEGRLVGAGKNRKYKKFGTSVRAGMMLASGGVRLFGAALLNAIPVIGQIIFIGSLLIGFLGSFFKSSDKAKTGVAALQEANKNFADNLKDFNTGVENTVLLLRKNDESFDSVRQATFEVAQSTTFAAGAFDELSTSVLQAVDALEPEKITKFEKGMQELSNSMSWLWDNTITRGIGDFFSMIGDGFSYVYNVSKDAIVDTFFEKTEDSLVSITQTDVNKVITEAAKGIKDIAHNSIAAKMILDNFFGDEGFIGYMEMLKEAGVPLEEQLRVIEEVITSVNARVQSFEGNAKGFADGIKELDKNLGQFIQKARKTNEFDVFADTFEQLQKTFDSMAEDTSFEQAITDISGKLEGTTIKNLERYGLTLENLFEKSEDGTFKLTELGKAFRAVADQERAINNLKESTAAIVSYNKAAGSATVETNDFNRKLETLSKTGEFSLDPIQQIESAKERAKIEKDRILLEFDVKTKLLNAEYDLLVAKVQLDKSLTASEAQSLILRLRGIQAIKSAELQAVRDVATVRADSALQTSLATAGQTGTTIQRIGAVSEAGTLEDGTTAEKLKALSGILTPMVDQLKQLGPEGEFVQLATQGLFSIANAFNIMSQEGIKSAEGLEAVGSVITAISSVMAANSKAQIANIDSQIEAEKKRDGKSKESLAKIQAMEKKKDAMARKSFETNKKMQMASTVVNTAAAIVKTLADPTLDTFTATALSIMIGALGAAQLAVIARTKYSGGAQSAEKPAATNLSIGNRSSNVDVSRRATAGELSYLRGGSTTGQNMGGAGASFPGAAMGRRGYADGGVVVGERGPEVITPATPVDITPNYALDGGTTNVNFSINAIDAAGVEDVLMNQQGNIIRMIRQAANENGQDFLPDVDTMAYGSKT